MLRLLLLLVCFFTPGFPRFFFFEPPPFCCESRRFLGLPVSIHNLFCATAHGLGLLMVPRHRHLRQRAGPQHPGRCCLQCAARGPTPRTPGSGMDCVCPFPPRQGADPPANLLPAPLPPPRALGAGAAPLRRASTPVNPLEEARGKKAQLK